MSPPLLAVARPGPSTWIVVGPARHVAHTGRSRGGAADPQAFNAVNRALGNEDDAPALEVTLGGLELEALCACTVAVGGAVCDIGVDGSNARAWQPIALRAGQRLSVGNCVVGVRVYCAVAGGFAGPRERALVRRDVLADAARVVVAPRIVAPAAIDAQPTLRIVDGLQAAAFPAEARRALVDGRFVVGRDSDRRGVRLEGPPIPAPSGAMITEGAPWGTVQVPPSGLPIVLGVDQCTTGGYAKIAQVIAVDRWMLGQLRPGAPVRFARVTLDEARALLRASAP